MEEKNSKFEPIVSFARTNILFISLISAGLIFAIFGLFQYLSSNKADEVEFVAASPKQEVQGVSTSKISIDVEGSVQKPGVYSLPDSARLQDALIAAGGLSKGADRSYVSKRLNLAQKVADGGKIYIPAVGEIDSKSQSVDTYIESNPVSVDSSEQTTGLIDINSATEEQLDTLPKVGPVIAGKIIANRPYGSVEELVSKKVLGQKTFEGLKDKITVQ